MPFTLSHPAAVLPLFQRVRHPIYMTALVVGSLSPDFGYYLRAFGVATTAHSLAGSILISMPSAVMALGLILLFRNSLFYLMPSRISSFLQAALSLPPENKWSLAASIGFWAWMGSCTHILWDAFTHRTGWFVKRVPFLQESFLSIHGSPLPTYYLLQQLSTLIGLAILFIFTLSLLSRTPPDPTQRRGDALRYIYWTSLVLVSILGALPFAWIFASQFTGFLQIRSFLFQTAILSGAIFISLFLISLITSALVLRRAKSN
jgi:hypothetical protein